MANLIELFDNIVQMEALNGVPLANGHMYVYALGRTRLMDTWSDIEGTVLNTNPIILDNAGQCHCYVSDAFDYTCVVCDEYNNEVFSIDKYLYSKGEHSHADVAVAPSEHIAVSSYHVGETTVYVPYIQGELGKTYHGVEPIVVNNQENKISARNIPLGVQEPLFFVEDSESACIIGASGLQPSGNYATVEWVTEHGYMQKEKLEFNESGQVTGFDGSAFAAGYVDPSDFIPWSASSTFQSAGNYATTDDLRNYYSASNPSGFINSDAISAMATTGFVADVSADITAMIPTGDYLTKESADELYQPIGDYATTADLTGKQDALTFGYTDDQISTINGSGIYGQGGGVTGEYELSAGNGISINNDPINQKTVISVSGDYATNSDLQTVSGEITAMIPGDYLTKDSADTLYYGIDNPSGFITGVDLTDYAKTEDLTAYQLSGEYYSASNPSGFITGVDLTPYQTTAEMTAYLTTGDSANFYTTANESGFITGVDLTPYQLTADMTAYQPVGSYLTADALDSVSGDWNEVSAKLDTTAFSDVSGTFLTAHQDISNKLDTTAFSDVSGSFLTAVPDTYLQNTDLTIVDNKVTEISGVELSAGTELEFEYDAADNISAINNSAISTTPAQDLYAKSPLYFDVTGTSSYMGINSADLARILGVDETVLWETNEVLYQENSAVTLSENFKNFKELDVYYQSPPDDNYTANKSLNIFRIDPTRVGTTFSIGGNYILTNDWWVTWYLCIGTSADGTSMYITNAHHTWGQSAYSNGFGDFSNAGQKACGGIYKVVGIGRKEV